MSKLISFLSALMLIFSFSGCSKKAKNDIYTIAVFQFSNSSYSESVDGILAALKDGGYIDGQNCHIRLENAHGDFSTAQTIARKLVSDEVDIIITSTTPCLQVTAMENKTIPHVFGTVTDPLKMNIGTSRVDHQPNLTGIGTFQPVEDAIKLMHQIIPDLDNIGLIWNSAEACSEACTEIAREVAASMGFRLSEVLVSNSSEVPTAAQSLVDKKVDVIFVSGDNTVSSDIEGILSVADKMNVPVVTNTPSDCERGVLFGLGADYYLVGYETGKLALRVINGEDPKDIPIQDFFPEKLWINGKTAEKLGIELTDLIKNQADRIL
jgi:putative tryptophan/tyrosine transport system permease protein